jgi:hypothetical protein
VSARRLLGAAGLGFGLVVAVLGTRGVARRPSPPAAASLAPPAPAAAGDTAATPVPRADTLVGAPGSPAPPAPTRFIRRARAALERQIADAGVGATLGDADREALLAALASVRASARRTRRRDRTDPAAEAAHARTVVAADGLFHAKLGVGIAAFLAAQGPPGRVRDLGAARP